MALDQESNAGVALLMLDIAVRSTCMHMICRRFQYEDAPVQLSTPSLFFTAAVCQVIACTASAGMCCSEC